MKKLMLLTEAIIFIEAKLPSTKCFAMYDAEILIREQSIHASIQTARV